MKKPTILDENIRDSNYGSFRPCRINGSGKVITFIYANGVEYNVPLSYFLQWYHGGEPHFVYQDGKWVDWDKSKHKIPSFKNVFVKKCRRSRNRRCLRVYLSNGVAYDAVWDTVLMSCEKSYEHFGGFTKESKRMTREYFKNIK